MKPLTPKSTLSPKKILTYKLLALDSPYQINTITTTPEVWLATFDFNIQSKHRIIPTETL